MSSGSSSALPLLLPTAQLTQRSGSKAWITREYFSLQRNVSQQEAFEEDSKVEEKIERA